MDDPLDTHFALVDSDRSVERMRKAVECLENASIQYVAEGGWAVAAYGSTVPSVDLDVLAKGGLSEALAAKIEQATGIQMFSQMTQDALAIDIVDLDEANALIDRPHLSYVPSSLIGTRIAKREIALVEGLRLPVPAAPVLAFMKLKAFHDRRLQYQAASGQRFLLQSFPERDRLTTVRRGAPYWIRKAGKDLYDASFLAATATTMAEIEASAPEALWSKVSMSLQAVPLPLREFAMRMTERSGPSRLPLLGT